MKVVVTGVIVIAVVELVAVERAPGLLLIAAGIPVAVALGRLIWSLLERAEAGDAEAIEDTENGPAEMLRRWHARAQTLADRADGSRADWDRHLRPLLAKQFELSSGHRVAKNRSAVEAAGVHQFGPELWHWVDPADSDLRDRAGRAPGRAVLEEILSRLQRM
ncbi:hypothetical protein [Nocardia sp. R7R-8]|uniref:hypothetical protein n=1 Tax=Nocardia sp. R7R-8 TaxID=3459304 RepID=UPI00403DBA52